MRNGMELANELSDEFLLAAIEELNDADELFEWWGDIGEWTRIDGGAYEYKAVDNTS